MPARRRGRRRDARAREPLGPQHEGRGAAAIYKDVNSPWLGINLDTGNWPGDPYEGIERLAPYATIVQAKTYYGGGVWYTLDLDYKRIAKILKKAGFKGWVSLEMEGKEPAATAVRRASRCCARRSPEEHRPRARAHSVGAVALNPGALRDFAACSKAWPNAINSPSA